MRSERQLVELLDYNLLFRWFVGLGMVLRRGEPCGKTLHSDEHFTVEGILIQARASEESFCRKGGSDDSDVSNFHGEERSDETHRSTTDADGRLYKDLHGRESKLAYPGHMLVENRMIASAMATTADGYAERAAAPLDDRQQGSSRRITVGADKAFDTQDFVAAARAIGVTPHVQKHENGRRSNLDARTTRHVGYAISLGKRWLVEDHFGWLKQTSTVAQVKFRRLPNFDWLFVFGCAAPPAQADC